MGEIWLVERVCKWFLKSVWKVDKQVCFCDGICLEVGVELFGESAEIWKIKGSGVWFWGLGGRVGFWVLGGLEGLNWWFVILSKNKGVLC